MCVFFGGGEAKAELVVGERFVCCVQACFFTGGAVCDNPVRKRGEGFHTSWDRS